jgi:hypothetical protein
LAAIGAKVDKEDGARGQRLLDWSGSDLERRNFPKL